jgi:hypothetical protein
MSRVYSFEDVVCTISGPFASFDLSKGAGVADEGISIDFDEDKATKTMGAGGDGMYSLHAAQGGSCTIRLLKTSPMNARLSQMYDYETSSSAYYGQDTITVRDAIRGDNWVLQGCGFRRHPPGGYGKEGGIVEWSFHALVVDGKFGDGSPITAFSRVA